MKPAWINSCAFRAVSSAGTVLLVLVNSWLRRMLAPESRLLYHPSASIIFQNASGICSRVADNHPHLSALLSRLHYARLRGFELGFHTALGDPVAAVGPGRRYIGQVVRYILDIEVV